MIGSQLSGPDAIKRATVHVELATDTAKVSLSIEFPERLARIVTMFIHNFSHENIESHGFGIVSIGSRPAIRRYPTLWPADKTGRYRDILRRYSLMQANP